MHHLGSPRTLALAFLVFVGFFLWMGSYGWARNFLPLFWALTAAVHVLFAVGIARDAADKAQTGTPAYFVEPFVWGLATLIGGFFVVAVYWLFHYSTLRRD